MSTTRAKPGSHVVTISIEEDPTPAVLFAARQLREHLADGGDALTVARA